MNRKTSGSASLIESVTIIACLAIFLTLSVATWQHYASNISARMAAYQVKDELLTARARAEHQHASVVVCGTGDATHCDGHWSSGQLTFDAAHPQQRVYSAGWQENIVVRFTGNLGKNKMIIFEPSGHTHGQEGHFSICARHAARFAQHCYHIRVNFLGQIDLREHRHA